MADGEIAAICSSRSISKDWAWSSNFSNKLKVSQNGENVSSVRFTFQGCTCTEVFGHDKVKALGVFSFKQPVLLKIKMLATNTNIEAFRQLISSIGLTKPWKIRGRILVVSSHFKLWARLITLCLNSCRYENISQPIFKKIDLANTLIWHIFTKAKITLNFLLSAIEPFAGNPFLRMLYLHVRATLNSSIAAFKPS